MSKPLEIILKYAFIRQILHVPGRYVLLVIMVKALTCPEQNKVISGEGNGFRYHYTNMPCQCGYPDGMSPRGRMVFPRAEPSGKPSSRGEIFHQDTHTGMAYLFYYTQQTEFGNISKKKQ